MKALYLIAITLHRAAQRREHNRAVREMIRLARLRSMRQEMVRSTSLRALEIQP